MTDKPSHWFKPSAALIDAMHNYAMSRLADQPEQRPGEHEMISKQLSDRANFAELVAESIQSIVGTVARVAQDSLIEVFVIGHSKPCQKTTMEPMEGFVDALVRYLPAKEEFARTIAPLVCRDLLSSLSPRNVIDVGEGELLANEGQLSISVKRRPSQPPRETNIRPAVVTGVSLN